jgi:hypothetical protein
MERGNYYIQRMGIVRSLVIDMAKADWYCVVTDLNLWGVVHQREDYLLNWGRLFQVLHFRVDWVPAYSVRLAR